MFLQILRCKQRKGAAGVENSAQPVRRFRVNQDVRRNSTAPGHRSSSVGLVTLRCRLGDLRSRNVELSGEMLLDRSSARRVVKRGCQREPGTVRKWIDALYQTFAETRLSHN